MTPTPIGTGRERLPVCTVEGAARAQTTDADLPPCAMDGCTRGFKGLADNCECVPCANMPRETLRFGESGAIGANLGNVSPGPTNAPRIENSGQSGAERAGGVVRGWAIYGASDKLVRTVTIKPVHLPLGFTMRPVIILPVPAEPLPPERVPMSQESGGMPDPQSPCVKAAEGQVWVARFADGEIFRARPVLPEWESWTLCGYEEAATLTPGEMKAQGMTVERCFILPAPTDPMQPEPAHLDPQAAGLLLAALTEQTRAVGEVVELRAEVERLKAEQARQERCPTCHGQGGYPSVLKARQVHPDWKTASCPDCSGSGYAPQAQVLATPLEREAERMRTQVLQRDAEIARLQAKVESLRRVLERCGGEEQG